MLRKKKNCSTDGNFDRIEKEHTEKRTNLLSHENEKFTVNMWFMNFFSKVLRIKHKIVKKWKVKVKYSRKKFQEAANLKSTRVD